MEELTLKVSKNIKRIEVNDEGEYITLNLDDQTFVPRLISLMAEFEAAADDYFTRAAEIENLPEESQKERFEKIAAAANFNRETCAELKAKVDAAFQDDICRKVFGDIVPSVEMFADFFAQLGALLKQFGKEKNAKIEKYTKKYSKRE